MTRNFICPICGRKVDVEVPDNDPCLGRYLLPQHVVDLRGGNLCMARRIIVQIVEGHCVICGKTCMGHPSGMCLACYRACHVSDQSELLKGGTP